MTTAICSVLGYIFLDYYVIWKQTSVSFEPLPTGFLLFNWLNLTLTDTRVHWESMSSKTEKHADSPAWTAIPMGPHVLCDLFESHFII